MSNQNTNPVPEGTFIHYVRNTDREIVGTVAFRPNGEGTVNRGIAVTGIGESGARRIGRKIALNRLAIAMEEGASSRAMNFKRDACARFAMCYGATDSELHKCGFNVEATEKEKHILEAAVKAAKGDE
jgi:hypothetical protein